MPAVKKYDLGYGWVLANEKSGTYTSPIYTSYYAPDFRPFTKTCGVKLYHCHKSKADEIFYAAFSVKDGYCIFCKHCPGQGVVSRACFFASQMKTKLVGWHFKQDYLAEKLKS